MRKGFGLLSAILMTPVMANGITIDIKTTENNTPIGSIHFEDSRYGLIIKPQLSSMNPGLHGIHIHTKPSCADSGKAAGGHLDPKQTGKHLGPYQQGHLGDLPVLYVDQSGSANLVTLAPRLKVKDILNHSVMIHDGADSYSDQPLPLGGGAGRLACGVLKQAAKPLQSKSTSFQGSGDKAQ